MPISRLSPPPSFPLAQADLCVKCGLCLPHCPTYLEHRHEGDSPRGRISLMQGLASGTIPPSAALEQHLDGCLGCRACERVCPAQVPFGHLMDQGRHLLAQHRSAMSWGERGIALALTRRTLRRTLQVLLRLYRATGLQALLRRGRLLGRGRLARLESLLPDRDTPHRPRASEMPAGAPRVMLFTGCAGELFDRQGLQDAITVLEKIGQQVDMPLQQGCCGALHQHAGALSQAAALAQRNLQAFAGDAPVLCSASGCGATLLDYPDLVPGAAARQLRARVIDINAHVLRHWREGLMLRPLQARIAVHSPCTLKNVFRGEDAVVQLLRKIPGARIIELDAAQHCCGAAGSHFITQPDMADRLLQHKLDAAARERPDLIVSANLGCSLHLAAGLRRAGTPIEVLHPVSLIARQLRAEDA